MEKVGIVSKSGGGSRSDLFSPPCRRPKIEVCFAGPLLRPSPLTHSLPSSPPQPKPHRTRLAVLPSSPARATSASEAAWLADLEVCLRNAKSRFGDVCWSAEGKVVYAHKAFIYARSSGSFQQRFLVAPTTGNGSHHPTNDSSYSLSQNGHSYRPSFTPLSADFRSSSPTSIITTAPPSITDLTPLPLTNTDAAVFEAGLEYLYTGSKGAEVFAVLFEGFDEGIRDGEEELKGVAKLRQDLLYMWRSKLYADLSISLSDTAGTDFTVHRAVLASRSPYFKSLLLGDYIDSHQHQCSLPSPPFTSASTLFILGYCYAGTLDFSNRSYDLTTAFEIYRGAAYLSIVLLQAEVEGKIEQMMTLPRAARIYAFALAPDVNSQRLERTVLPLLVNHFNDTWNCPQIGNLDYDSQRKLVATLCAKITPETVATEGKKSFLLRKKIELERANWAVHIRSMLDAVDERVKSQVGKSLSTIVVSPGFVDLVDGVGFSTDVLEWLLELVVETLTEATAAESYQALVGSVLLREEGILMDAKVLVEDAKNGILKYLKRKWSGVRASRGFDKLESWCQKELADELEIPIEELLAGPKSTFSTARSTPRPTPKSTATSDASRITPAQRVQQQTGTTPIRAPRSSNASITSERSVSNGTRTTTATPATARNGLPAVRGRVSVPVDRTARSSNSLPAPPTATLTTPAPRTPTTSTSGPRPTLPPAPVIPPRTTSTTARPSTSKAPAATVTRPAATVRRPPSLAPTVASTRSVASTSTSRGVRSSPASSPLPSPKTPKTPKTPTTPRSVVTKAETPRPSTAKGKEPAMPLVRPVKRPSSVASGRTAKSNATDAPAARPSSATSVRAAASPALKRPKSASSLKTPRAAGTNGSSTASTPTTSRPSPKARRPSIPTSSPVSRTNGSVPSLPPPLPTTTPAIPGTTLLSGIPCIVTVTSERQSRFKALVRYIGGRLDAEGQWIGIEVAESIIPEEAQALAWNDGSVGEAVYFKISSPEPAHGGRATPQVSESGDGRSAGGSSTSSLRPPSRRGRRSSSSDQENGPRRGLFVRPHQIVYVL